MGFAKRNTGALIVIAVGIICVGLLYMENQRTDYLVCGLVFIIGALIAVALIDYIGYKTTRDDVSVGDIWEWRRG